MPPLSAIFLQKVTLTGFRTVPSVTDAGGVTGRPHDRSR